MPEKGVRMPSLATYRARLALLAVLSSILPASAQAQSWSWFAEPYSVRVATVHPQAGAMEGLIVVDADAVRTEWSFGGMLQVSVARPEGDGVRLRSLMPDGSVADVLLTGVAAYELLVQGYVAAVTPPEDPRHPCSASPDTHRCALQAEETLDGRALERWRIESDTRDGGVHGQLFWFDRAAGVVVRALDDAGADLRFSDHRRGPVDAGAFELP
ncbi:MAG: hypothetical protein K0A98_06830 [Trueperaceae bacterium]|nr:hypothetical protein [Trueperaceae bacterium]